MTAVAAAAAAAAMTVVAAAAAAAAMTVVAAATAAAEAGAAKLSKTAKDNRFHTPRTLPKAGAADLRRLRRVPGAALEV